MMDYVALPKVELHAHLTGSVSRRTLHEIWQRKKAAGQTTLDDPLTVMPEGKHDFNLQTFFPLFSSYIYNLLTDEESVRYATTSVLRSFMDDGVVYLELRTTPRATPELTPDQLVTAIVGSIRDFEAANPALHTRLILCVDRRHDVATAESVLDLALAHRRLGGGGGIVVGLDLCGDPTARAGGEVSLFDPVFRRAAVEDLPVTVHFAEAEASGSRPELDVLLAWNPRRLGHVIWEDEETKAEVARRGLCLELCLSCNVQAGMIKGGFESHHFGHWKDVQGPSISLATDDVGVFGSSLSNEYRLVAEHFNLNRGQICSLAKQSINGIFGGEAERQRLRELMWSD